MIGRIAETKGASLNAENERPTPAVDFVAEATFRNVMNGQKFAGIEVAAADQALLRQVLAGHRPPSDLSDELQERVSIESKIAGVMAGHKMAGFDVTEEHRNLCRMIFADQLDVDEYVADIRRSNGLIS